uniref:Mucin like 3 n=1 Tax=Canis lupus dingo TaxID=286419 RepID=A0A8C0L591_CANLU
MRQPPEILAQRMWPMNSSYNWDCCATAFRELQKTGVSPASDHLLPPTSGLVYSTLSDYTALHLGHNPLDLTKSTEIHKRKSHCNTTHHIKPTYKPIDNPQNSTSDYEVSPSSEKKPSNQGKNPNIQNRRPIDPNDSTNTHKGLSGAKYSTLAPKRKPFCNKPNVSKIGTGNIHKTATSFGNTITTLDSKSTTSHKTIIPVHTSVNTEINKIPTSSSGKSTAVTKSTRIPERSEGAEDGKIVASSGTTVASGKTVRKTTEHINRITSPIEKITQILTTLTEHKQRTASAHINTTRSLESPLGHGKEATLANKTTPRIQAESTKHGEETKSANGKTTTTQEKKTTAASGKTTRALGGLKNPGEKTTTVSGKTTSTSHMKLSSTMSEIPDNESHPYQNEDGSHRGVHAGGRRENDSFPAWAIVIVVLVAVILFLMFLSLIFLVSYMTKTRQALIQNKEDNDPEDDGGPNSYPVHLMEQQTLGMGQITSPR